MEQLVKPITIKHQEFIQNLTDMINSSGLPCFVIESVLVSMLHDVSALAKQQYELDMKRFEETQKAMNNKAAIDNVQDDRKEVQVP